MVSGIIIAVASFIAGVAATFAYGLYEAHLYLKRERQKRA